MTKKIKEYQKNARKLYHKFLNPNEAILKDGNKTYYIHDGFKFEKTTLFDGRTTYKVYSTYVDSYQEIIQEIVLMEMLNSGSLKGMIHKINRINNTLDKKVFINLLNELLHDK